jgi:putative DNA primase/helicase
MENVDDPPVLFPTQETRESLGQPEKGGSIHILKEKFHLSSQNEALIVSFCVGCLRGAGPYPVLVILGPEGSGKTALANFVRGAVDPATPMLRNPPKNEAELAITARNNHVVAYDDVHRVVPWLGSAICRVSKGTTLSECRGGQEHILFQGARPVILAGSEEMLLNRELASRALVVRLDPRSNFKPGVAEDFRGRAQFQGALLDIIVHGLGRVHDVEIPTPVRDYELERWIAACELSRWGLGEYEEVYKANVSDGAEDLVQLDPLLMGLRDYLATVKTFRGTAGQLLKELNATTTFAKGNRWPESPQVLALRLRSDAKLLPEIDMEFIRKGHNRDRLIVATFKPLPEQPEEGNSEPPKFNPEVTTGSRRKVSGKRQAAVDQPQLFQT